MASLQSDPLLPLTLSEQLDAMLSGWLERHAPAHDHGRTAQVAKAVITVARDAVNEVREFCARWGMGVETIAANDWRRAILIVEGGALQVRGFTEIAAM
jgi:hypothetical protein